jgi:hypothetical protein
LRIISSSLLRVIQFITRIWFSASMTLLAQAFRSSRVPVSSLHSGAIFSRTEFQSRRFSPQFLSFNLVVPTTNSGQGQTWEVLCGRQEDFVPSIELTHL